MNSVLRACLLAALCGAMIPARPAEVQAHGLVFEQWVRDTFFAGHSPAGYTQPWDIPAAANRAHGDIPVNPKAVKYGSAIDLGDALRQAAIDEPFLLVLGFWRQEGDTKRFVAIVPVRVEPAAWRRLWSPITAADLARLDAVIKDRSLTPAQAQAAARSLKSAAPFSQAIIVLNPKIDSHTQRRLQYSLRFADVFRYLAPDASPAIQERPELWGVPFPPPITSPARQFER